MVDEEFGSHGVHGYEMLLIMCELNCQSLNVAAVNLYVQVFNLKMFI